MPRTAFADLDHVTEYLYALPRGGKSVGLARATALFRALDNPQDQVRTIHIAGTAGKGSISAFLSSILTAHGLRVGAHMSPHVRSILERFQINGQPISDAAFVEAVTSIAPSVARLGRSTMGTPTFFEVANAIAFHHFSSMSVDYSVIETGIGGLRDATNTISRTDKLAVIGRIGLDHTDLLGDTVAQVAHHKAGILPVGGHGIFLRPHQSSVHTALLDAARTRRCTFTEVGNHDAVTTVTPEGTVLHLDGADYPLGLPGHHQGNNAMLALRAAEHLSARDGWDLVPDAVHRGLSSASLPGRFQRHVVRGREVILDGAHNHIKFAALVDTFRAVHPEQRATWVLAMKGDKDPQGAIAAITPVAEHVVVTRIPEADTDPLAAWQLAEVARTAGLPVTSVDDPREALDIALEMSHGPVVVSGSFLLLSAIEDGIDALVRG
ncbi:folylpolyglutamate synthase [Gordonia rhizosphera NBRC 16068]|uniref:tetrahydrofolate synthase n=2 Tax=Gordonia rhizosphera TaxID=83341 RepID=K6WGT0_9ACTN|nr:folylpolyglutamate synthase [Gordonia rhizosphera NBRC 16068]